jgi:transcriptional regulator with XRE-family HTH domain
LTILFEAELLDMVRSLCEGTSMVDRPDPPAWGVLISAELRDAGMSAREAARRAGISEGRWRQICSGYQVVSPGVYAQVRGPAATLARMATVAGLTPEQLTAAGRDDAARVMLRQQEDRPDRDEMLARVRAMDTDQARDLLATIAHQLGVDLGESEQDERHRRYGA